MKIRKHEIDDVCMYVCMYVQVCMYVCIYGHHIEQSMNQPGKVANSARGQLIRES